MASLMHLMPLEEDGNSNAYTRTNNISGDNMTNMKSGSEKRKVSMLDAKDGEEKLPVLFLPLTDTKKKKRTNK